MEGNFLTMSEAVANDDGCEIFAEADFDVDDDDGFGDPDLSLLSENAAVERQDTAIDCTAGVDERQTSRKTSASTTAEGAAVTLKKTRQEASSSSGTRPLSFSECIANAKWESLVTAATTFRTPLAVDKLPWERGFAASVFGKPKDAYQWVSGPLKAVQPPKMPISLWDSREALGITPEQAEKDAAEVVKKVHDAGAWHAVATRFANIRWDEDDEYDREAVLRKWKTIMQLAPERSVLGRKLMTNILHMATDDFLMKVLGDVFAGKATLTLQKRADSMIKYVRHMQLVGRDPFPVVAFEVYMCIKSEGMKSPSAGQSLREAMSFAGGLIGLDGAIDAAADPLVKGAAGHALCKKRIRKQAKPFKVTVVQTMLQVILVLQNFCDVVMLGQLLFLTTVRGRWSDGQFIDSLEEDFTDEGGYIQANTVRHKTANTPEKKRTYLEMTGPVAILGDKRWYFVWIKAREAVGLGRVSNPMVPVVNKDGRFGSRPLQAGQAGVWMREIFAAHGIDDEYSSTHRCKVTFLSWLAKFGGPYLERSVLGYHAVRGLQSTFCYGRDNLAGPLRTLDRMLLCIVNGTFNPDLTRSGFFRNAGVVFVEPKPKKAAARATEVEAAAESERAPGEAVAPEPEPSDEDQSDTDSDSDDESDADEEEEQGTVSIWDAVLGDKGRRPAGHADDQVLFHTARMTLHRCKHESDRTRCGKVITNVYKVISDEPHFDYPRCKMCFGSAA